MFLLRVQMFEAHTGVGGAELPMDALLGRVATAHAVTCVGTEPAASGHSLWSQRSCRGVNTNCTRRANQRASAGGNAWKKRGVSVGVQIVADQDQALGLAVARIIREGLHLARPVYAARAPQAQQFHEHPEGAGAAPHVFVVVGGGPARARRLRRPLSARNGLGCSSMQITG